MVRNRTTFLALLMTCLVLNLVFLPRRPANQAHAQTTNTDVSASSPSAELDSQTTDNLKKRIEKVVQDKREEIKGVIDILKEKKRGFIGQIERVAEESLTIKTSKGVKIVSLNENVKLLKSSSTTTNKTVKVSEIAVGDWAMVVGTVVDDTLVPQTITTYTTSLRPRDHLVVLGNIASLEKNSVTLNPRSGDATETLTLNTATKYQDITGKTIKATALSEQLQALVVGYNDPEKGKIATVVRVLTTLDTAK